MTEETAATEDVALVLGASPDGERVGVLRKRGDDVSAAVLSRAREGAPLHGDLVRLKERSEENLYDVETVYAAPHAEPPREGTGPAQVANDEYRSGWARVFRKRRGSLPS